MKILLCLFWLACANDATPSSQSTNPLEMSVQDLYPISKDALIIDVRTPGEFQSGHVPGARHIPLDSLKAQLPNLSTDQDQAVYFICASGVRSAKAAQMAQAHGYTKAINIKDGTYGWRAAGFPLE